MSRMKKKIGKNFASKIYNKIKKNISTIDEMKSI